MSQYMFTAENLDREQKKSFKITHNPLTKTRITIDIRYVNFQSFVYKYVWMNSFKNKNGLETRWSKIFGT